MATAAAPFVRGAIITIVKTTIIIRNITKFSVRFFIVSTCVIVWKWHRWLFCPSCICRTFSSQIRYLLRYKPSGRPSLPGAPKLLGTTLRSRVFTLQNWALSSVTSELIFSVLPSVSQSPWQMYLRVSKLQQRRICVRILQCKLNLVSLSRTEYRNYDHFNRVNGQLLRHELHSQSVSVFDV